MEISGKNNTRNDATDYAGYYIFENIVFHQSGNNNTHFASGGWQYQSDYGDFDSNNNYNGGYFGREIGKNYLYAFGVW